ncbi:MAG: D-tyrosyl-tRNA(Tyr) deacylase [Bacilli bacterium]|nr:D-tyrosyl-tRNA(Tyr) deacylase [Bacilli bacterium]
MKVVVQRSRYSKVEVSKKIVGKIDKGLVVLVSFTEGDGIKQINWMVNKILGLRIFDDENGIMNKSVIDIGASILSISQFTLYADCIKGNRPSYHKALKSNEASVLYDLFNKKLKEHIKVETGIFGSEMLLEIQNDGPVTIILEK